MTNGIKMLTLPVGPRDHIIGAAEAPVTLVEYGDYECPFCGQAHKIVAELIHTGPAPCAMSFAIFRSRQRIPTPSKPPNLRKPLARNANSGRCIICCSPIRNRSICKA